MNIYLTGAHGTGKTTAAYLVAEKTGFETLPSVSRNSPYKQGTEEHQRYVMDRVMHRTKIHDQTIQDRTPVDVFAYTTIMELHGEYNRQKALAQGFLKAIGHSDRPLFYFPICFPLVNDGVRPGKWEQLMVDSAIKFQLQASGIEYYVMPDATPEERADFILERVPHAELRL